MVDLPKSSFILYQRCYYDDKVLSFCVLVLHASLWLYEDILLIVFCGPFYQVRVDKITKPLLNLTKNSILLYYYNYCIECHFYNGT